RWDGGRARLARTRVLRLAVAAIRERRPALLDAALQVALPPLSVLAAGAVAGLAIALVAAIAGIAPVAAAVPWALATLCVAMHVLVGLAATHAPAATYRALAHAPLFVARKLLGSGRALTFAADTWVRTQRPGER